MQRDSFFVFPSKNFQLFRSAVNWVPSKKKLCDDVNSFSSRLWLSINQRESPTVIAIQKTIKVEKIEMWMKKISNIIEVWWVRCLLIFVFCSFDLKVFFVIFFCLKLRCEGVGKSEIFVYFSNRPLLMIH